MHNQTSNQTDQPVKTAADSQKGTLLSVMLVGAFIALMWAGIFWLYMIRI